MIEVIPEKNKPEGEHPLHILFLGPLRYELGIDSLDLPFPDSPSQEALWSLLYSKFAVLRHYSHPIRLARNGEFLQVDELLNPGDEIALLPPVSGG